MRRVVERSTVKPGQETVNEKLAQAVYDELHQTQPTGPQPAVPSPAQSRGSPPCRQAPPPARPGNRGRLRARGLTPGQMAEYAGDRGPGLGTMPPCSLTTGRFSDSG
jgi:hypothetical protein